MLAGVGIYNGAFKRTRHTYKEIEYGTKARFAIQFCQLTRRPLGLRANRQPLGGGAYSCPLYFCDDIVATRRDREAKLCTHLADYLAEVVSKFGVDRI